jgi:hypothetical protein
VLSRQLFNQSARHSSPARSELKRRDARRRVPPLRAPAAPRAGLSAAAPTIIGFRPSAGTVGTVVTLTGSGFSGAGVVELVHATARFTVVSDARIRSELYSDTAWYRTLVDLGGDVKKSTLLSVRPIRNF